MESAHKPTPERIDYLLEEITTEFTDKIILTTFPGDIALKLTVLMYVFEGMFDILFLIE